MRAGAEGEFRGDGRDVAEIDWVGEEKKWKRGFRGGVRGSARRTRRRIWSGRERRERSGCSSRSEATADLREGSGAWRERSTRMADLSGSEAEPGEAKTRAATRCQTMEAFAIPAGEKGETGKQSVAEGEESGWEEGEPRREGEGRGGERGDESG